MRIFFYMKKTVDIHSKNQFFYQHGFLVHIPLSKDTLKCIEKLLNLLTNCIIIAIALWELTLKSRSHGAICSACNSIFLHVILRDCSYGAMGVDAICCVYILESHITIAQNLYETNSCATLHTQMNCTQSKSHCVDNVFNIHTIHFLHHNRKQKNAPCERALRVRSRWVITNAITNAIANSIRHRNRSM